MTNEAQPAGPINGELEISMLDHVELPKLPPNRLGATQYPFDLVSTVGAGFAVNRTLGAVRKAVGKFNKRNQGKRQFTCRFVGGKTLVKRIL